MPLTDQIRLNSRIYVATKTQDFQVQLSLIHDVIKSKTDKCPISKKFLTLENQMKK